MMVNILRITYYVVLAITILYASFFTISGILGLIKKSKIKKVEAKKKNHFAILVAARNEADTIGNLLDSLNELNYPKNKYDVYVIPNNCTDDTAGVSKKHKAKVIDCTVKTKTKGDVLNFTFGKLKKNKEIDAYVVFDADNVVHPDFLIHMNNALEAGYRVAQGFRDAKNPDDNWISGSYTLFYLIQNIFFNRARMSLGGSSSINGTGFMIKKELIDERGFETYTLTEDVEFTGQCALNKEKIVFVEEAVTFDEYPTHFGASWKQRKRWSAGVLECMKLYSPKLFWDFIKTGNLASIDMSLTYMGPIMLILNFFNIVMAYVFKFAHIETNDFITFIFASSWQIAIIAYLVGILFNIMVMLIKKKKPSSIISGLLLFGVFIYTWVPINIMCLIKKHTKWEEIKHDRSISIDEMMKNKE